MATILRGYRTELDLNNQQRTVCLRHAGAARWAYNYGLARKQEAIALRKSAPDPQSVKIPTAIDLHNELIALKNGEKPWLKEASKWAPQQALRNLDTAYTCNAHSVTTVNARRGARIARSPNGISHVFTIGSRVSEKTRYTKRRRRSRRNPSQPRPVPQPSSSKTSTCPACSRTTTSPRRSPMWAGGSFAAK